MMIAFKILHPDFDRYIISTFKSTATSMSAAPGRFGTQNSRFTVLLVFLISVDLFLFLSLLLLFKLSAKLFDFPFRKTNYFKLLLLPFG